MSSIIVGVIRGGPSNEYDVSLATGSNMLKALREHFAGVYEPRDILISKNSKWQIDGIIKKPEDIISSIDVALLALHGNYGEDGKIQQFLELHGKPFTGSGSLASAVAMNKNLSKKAFAAHGIKVAADKIVESKKIKKESHITAQEIFRSFSLPVVVKPVCSGSSVGISLAKDLSSLEKGLIEAAKHSDEVMVEEYIKGIETTVGVIEKFRGEELYALPPVEIRSKKEFFDFEAKYEGKSEEIVPATYSTDLKIEVSELGRKAHKALGLRHYSRSDFIIHPKRGIFALEVNTLPGMTNESLIPKELRAVGSDGYELIDHLIKLALGL